MINKAHADHHEGEDVYTKTLFGFWLYLFTDFMLFATIFATYAVLATSTFGGPSGAQLFDLPRILIQTLVLLGASFTSGLANVMAHKHNRKATIVWFGITLLLGIVFILFQAQEYGHLIANGNSWRKNAFLSAFFTLVGTHSLHVIFGLLWIIVLMIPTMIHGVTKTCVRRLTCLKMFWQFLSVLWIFIFAIVYLLGGVL